MSTTDTAPQDHPPVESPPARPRFYFVDEAAKELRRSEAATRWLIQTGQIKAGKLGGRVIIAAAEIDRLINAAFAD